MGTNKNPPFPLSSQKLPKEITNNFGQLNQDDPATNLNFAIGNVNYSNGKKRNRFDIGKLPKLLSQHVCKNQTSSSGRTSAIPDMTSTGSSSASSSHRTIKIKNSNKNKNKFFTKEQDTSNSSSQKLNLKIKRPASSLSKNSDRASFGSPSSSKKLKESDSTFEKDSKDSPVIVKKTAKSLAQQLTQFFSDEEDEDEEDDNEHENGASEQETQENFYDIPTQSSGSASPKDKSILESQSRTNSAELLSPPKMENIFKRKTSTGSVQRLISDKSPKNIQENDVNNLITSDSDTTVDSQDVDYNSRSYFFKRKSATPKIVPPSQNTKISISKCKSAIAAIEISDEDENDCKILSDSDHEIENVDPKPRKMKPAPKIFKKAAIKLDHSLKIKKKSVDSPKSKNNSKITSFFKPCSL